VKLEQHTFISESFQELIEEAIGFFDVTPFEILPPSEKFAGPGIYAIYYKGESEIYKNVYSSDTPIYIGKAVLPGWRQGRVKLNSNDPALYRRLREHSRNIDIVNNLELNDFICRFVVLPTEQSDLICTLEAALIRKYNPLWNSFIDGFGNHDPGKGRYNQAKSEWDVLHEGRKWADKLQGEAPVMEMILNKVNEYGNT